MIPPVSRFRIAPGARVLDIGCGGSPFPLATHLADLRLDDHSARLGFPIPLDARPFVACSVEALPFAAGSFDFVYCTHVLEHVANPGRACRELMRVGKAGYIECPRSWLEYAFESVDHRWLVDHDEGVLIFREKLDEERRDHLGIQYAIFDWLRDPGFRRYWSSPEVKAVRNTEFYWEGSFEFCVIPKSRRKNAGRFPWFYGRETPGRRRREPTELREYVLAELRRVSAR